MVALIKIAVELLADAARFSILLFLPTRSVQAENLFLRRQPALFKERGIQPRRVDAATRISEQLARVDATAHPSAAWTLQQLRELIGFDDAY
jgi:hypothetical protein